MTKTEVKMAMTDTMFTFWQSYETGIIHRFFYFNTSF